jgi:hypothetical protein
VIEEVKVSLRGMIPFIFQETWDLDDLGFVS